MTAEPRVTVRLQSLRLLGLEILEHAGGPVVGVEVNEGPDSVHPLGLRMREKRILKIRSKPSDLLELLLSWRHSPYHPPPPRRSTESSLGLDLSRILSVLLSRLYPGPECLMCTKLSSLH